MTKSHKIMCGCEICIDGRAYIQAYNKGQKRLLKAFNSTISSLQNEEDTDLARDLQEAKQEYVMAAFVVNGEECYIPQFQSLDDWVVETMTCPKIGPLNLYHYNCCLE